MIPINAVYQVWKHFGSAQSVVGRKRTPHRNPCNADIRPDGSADAPVRALNSPTAAKAASSSNASCWGHKLKLDLILSLPLGRNPDLFLTSSGAPTQKQFQRIDPSVIAIPDSGQFFSLYLRQSTICETRAVLLPGTEQTFDNANVRSATQEAPQELQHTRIVQSRARDCLRRSRRDVYP